MSLVLHSVLLLPRLGEAMPIVKVQTSKSSLTIKVSKKDRSILRKKNKTKVKKQITKNNATTPGALSDAKAIGTLIPKYPYESQLNGEEGRVVMRVFVSQSGKVENILLISSSGHKNLDSEAEKTIRKATFTPASRSGLPVDSFKDLTFNFLLNN
jgi:protein TonB